MSYGIPEVAGCCYRSGCRRRCRSFSPTAARGTSHVIQTASARMRERDSICASASISPQIPLRSPSPSRAQSTLLFTGFLPFRACFVTHTHVHTSKRNGLRIFHPPCLLFPFSESRFLITPLLSSHPTSLRLLSSASNNFRKVKYLIYWCFVESTTDGIQIWNGSLPMSAPQLRKFHP